MSANMIGRFLDDRDLRKLRGMLIKKKPPARSVRRRDVVRTIKARGASLKATEQPIDTNTAAGKCFLDMLGVFAEFETNLRRERQLEGIARAKAQDIYKGRPGSIDAAKIRAMKAKGRGATEIAKALKIGAGIGASGVGSQANDGGADNQARLFDALGVARARFIVLPSGNPDWTQAGATLKAGAAAVLSCKTTIGSHSQLYGQW
jgi:Resolvase, N terminal domain